MYLARRWRKLCRRRLRRRSCLRLALRDARRGERFCFCQWLTGTRRPGLDFDPRQLRVLPIQNITQAKKRRHHIAGIRIKNATVAVENFLRHFHNPKWRPLFCIAGILEPPPSPNGRFAGSRFFAASGKDGCCLIISAACRSAWFEIFLERARPPRHWQFAGQRHDRVIEQPLVVSGGVVEEETLAYPLPTGFGAIVIAIKFSNSKNIRANRERETGRQSVSEVTEIMRGSSFR